MPDLIALLTAYYICAPEAAAGRLTQAQRFACNESYQQAKRTFLAADERSLPDPYLTRAENTLAYQRFKAWERENAELVARLKAGTAMP